MDGAYKLITESRSMLRVMTYSPMRLVSRSLSLPDSLSQDANTNPPNLDNLRRSILRALPIRNN